MLSMIGVQMNDSRRVPGRTALVSRNIRLDGRRTSIKLEPAFWSALSKVAEEENVSIHDICQAVGDRTKGYGLTGAVRVFLLCYMSGASYNSALEAVPVGDLPE